MLENLKILPKYDGFIYFAESSRNPPRLNSHYHVELEINLVVNGAITYVANGQRYIFKKRSLVWFFPGQEHQMVDRSRDAQYYVVVFKPRLVARQSANHTYKGLSDNRAELAILHTQLEPESFDLMKKIMDSLMDGALDADTLNREAGFGFRSDFVFRHGDAEALNAGLHFLLLLSWRCRENGRALPTPVSLHPAVNNALDYIGRNPGNSPLDVLSKKSGLSPSYLCRVFKDQVGISISKYRNMVRIGLFFEIFNRPVRPTITEAVYEAGFGSYSQFYKVFYQSYGKGPKSLGSDSGLIEEINSLKDATS
jgi:methylphosphotriester-DNA--protein-cysteine methyltransferase